uniref:Chromosome 5 open reading frame 34 n=1 Tax=Leptobrachium leishanense TaxID=445787 RepID=A0A8C5LTE5_9ANUR
MAALSWALQFGDDSVAAEYEDGSRLWFSPCAAEFVYELPEAGVHTLRAPARRKQRSEFATSCCRDKVLQILDFRNTFSSRPFLPASIIPPERTLDLLSEVTEVEWPRIDDADRYNACVTRLEDGSVEVLSLDRNARLCLSAMQRELTVEYLCQLSCRIPNSAHDSEIHECGKYPKEHRGSSITRDLERADDKATAQKHYNKSKYSSALIEEKDGSLSYSTKHAFRYTWLSQRFSVAACPEVFLYPVSLALQAQNASFSDGERLDSCKELDKNLINGTFSTLPKALPLRCRGTHLHRWDFSVFGKPPSNTLPLKAALCGPVLYRFFYNSSDVIEVYPGDGSVFVSSGHCLGRYFQYNFINGKTKQKEQRMYVSSNLPPDNPRALYSVRSLITQAVRFLETCHVTAMLSQTPLLQSCCWISESDAIVQPVFPALLEKAFLPGEGVFSVFSDNSVLAHFMDGVYLRMTWNFSHFNKQAQTRRANNGGCLLHFPNGESILVQMDVPGDYSSYIKAAVSWCRQLDGRAQRETLPLAEDQIWMHWC